MVLGAGHCRVDDTLDFRAVLYQTKLHDAMNCGTMVSSVTALRPRSRTGRSAQSLGGVND